MRLSVVLLTVVILATARVQAAPFLLLGTDQTPGSDSIIAVLADADTNGVFETLVGSGAAFPSLTGGLTVAAGNIGATPHDDIIIGTATQADNVAAYGFDGALPFPAYSYLAYGGFAGGVYVAAGDVTGDGYEDIVTGAGAGGGPHVKVFDGVTQTQEASFFAYSAGYSGGVRVAAGDIDGDGRADVITGTGVGADHVKVFRGTDQMEIASFLAFGGAASGVFVAAGDVTGDGRADIVVGADAGAAAHVKVFDGVTGAMVHSFFAFDGFTGGVRVAAGDVNGDGYAEIIAAMGPGGGMYRVFDGLSLRLLDEATPMGTAYFGGLYVAVGGDFAPIPEPGTLALLSVGALLLKRTRRSRAA